MCQHEILVLKAANVNTKYQYLSLAPAQTTQNITISNILMLDKWDRWWTDAMKKVKTEKCFALFGLFNLPIKAGFSTTSVICLVHNFITASYFRIDFSH